MSSTLGVLILGAGFFGLGVATGAGEEETPSEQDEALNAVVKIATGQRTYYQDNGKFLDRVDDLEKVFGITLPSDYDYAIRTTDEAVYNYVIPTSDSLKAYVGATFLAFEGSSELTTIIELL